MKISSVALLALLTLPAYGHDAPKNKAAGAADGTNYVLKLEQLEHIDAAPGESIYLMRGSEHGFDSLSLILTETQPCGGPPIHVHESEEAHVLFEGCAEYLIGDKHFTAYGPYVARVPAGVPHTFMNCGKEDLHLTAIFPTSHYTFKFLKPSPLCTQKAK
jgi:mannose-6-phosphate isomerase-like protein (cupin superfamily)